MDYLLTGTEMGECDRRTSEVIGIPSLVLMERAALSVADGVTDHLSKLPGKRPVILAVAGRGNNGADALAAGRILLDRGYDVRFCRLSGEVSPESSFAVQETILHNYGVRVQVFSDCGLPGISGDHSSGPDVIIDGLFGTGLSRELKGEARACVEAVNRCRRLCGSYVIAVDIPSGISSEDGRVMGCAVQCDETRTFAFYKRGHFLYPGASFAGVCHLAQIGITERSFSGRPGMFTFLHETARDLLPARDPGGNKGTFGKVLILAGRRSMCGAAILAARACMSAGAGMVRIFTQESNREIIQQTVPEALLDTYEDSGLSIESINRLRSALEWADIAAAGPAMGTDEAARVLLSTILEECGSPRGRLRGLVLDADALRILSEEPELCGRLAARREDLPCILTPHLAEFAALAGKSVSVCAQQRISLVREQAQRLHCTIACKDARTLVASWTTPSGMYLNCSGNSGMAAAGSGDVLTGMTAAILALFTSGDGGPDLPDPVFDAEDLRTGFAAAVSAVYLHGLSGDMARERHGEQGTTALDLVESLRQRSFWS